MRCTEDEEISKLLHINFDNEWKIIMDIKKRKIFFARLLLLPCHHPDNERIHSLNGAPERKAAVMGSRLCRMMMMISKSTAVVVTMSDIIRGYGREFVRGAGGSNSN